MIKQETFTLTTSDEAVEAACRYLESEYSLQPGESIAWFVGWEDEWPQICLRVHAQVWSEVFSILVAFVEGYEEAQARTKLYR